MTFRPHPAQVQALKTAKRFRDGIRPTVVCGKKVALNSRIIPIRFAKIPLQVMMAEIDHLRDGAQCRVLLEDLCDRGYLQRLDGYRESTEAPMEYQTREGATIYVHDKDWCHIDFQRPGEIGPDGKPIAHGHDWAPGAGAKKLTNEELARGLRPGYSFRLQPEGYKLLDELDKSDVADEPSAKGGRDARGSQSRRPRTKPPRPAWSRLRIIKTNAGDDIARLGVEHRLTGANDARFLELLQAERGRPILASTLERTLSERPARIYERLPKAIQRIIDKPGRRTGKKGYRML